MVGIFADDARIWRQFCNDEEILLLQEELEKAYTWAADNNAYFNFDKFEAIRFKIRKRGEKLARTQPTRLRMDCLYPSKITSKI